MAPWRIEDGGDVWTISSGQDLRKTTSGAAKGPSAIQMMIAKSDGAIVFPVSSNNKELSDVGTNVHPLNSAERAPDAGRGNSPSAARSGGRQALCPPPRAEEAKAIHTMIFGDKATRPRNHAPAREENSGNSIGATAAWHPYAEGDSNILVGGKGRVKLDDLLTKALAPIGYVRVEKLTYRANWSTDDVEQFLSFDTYGNPKQYLSSSAGLRNPQAEAFAKTMSRTSTQTSKSFSGICQKAAMYFPVLTPYTQRRHILPLGASRLAEHSRFLAIRTCSPRSRWRSQPATHVPLVGAIHSCADLLKFLSRPRYEGVSLYTNGRLLSSRADRLHVPQDRSHALVDENPLARLFTAIGDPATASIRTDSRRKAISSRYSTTQTRRSPKTKADQRGLTAVGAAGSLRASYSMTPHRAALASR